MKHKKRPAYEREVKIPVRCITSTPKPVSIEIWGFHDGYKNVTEQYELKLKHQILFNWGCLLITSILVGLFLGLLISKLF